MSSVVLHPQQVEADTGCAYPSEFAGGMAGRLKRRLTAALGLGDFGVNMVELPPGAQSALRHWHSHEDEFIYVISGTLTLITDAGEQSLGAGLCAAFPKNTGDGHCLINRGQERAVYLEVGSRNPADRVVYPDVDLVAERRLVFAHKDGSLY